VALVVQKFGGTSVGDPERIRNVARRVVDTVKAGHRVAVVVSAMGGVTDRLVGLAREIGGAQPDPREYDVLVSTGEQQTIALLAMAIQQLGQPARSFTGGQMGLRTDASHTRARIERIDRDVLLETIDGGVVAVLAGFQGTDEAGNITTLGRGGSDTSAVAVAAALGADVCEIYTDVDGVFTTDPSMVSSARKLERISFDEMIEMASLGAKVLQIRSVRFAMRYGVPIHVRSSFHEGEGTWVVPEEEVMEGLVVSGVTYNRNEAKIRMRGVKDVPGVAARVFSPLSGAGIVVDMIIQNLSHDGSTDMTFTVPRDDYERALEITRATGAELGSGEVEGDTGIAKISIVGLGMKDHAGVATRMFAVLAGEGINIQLISTSEIKVSVVIEEKYTELAVRALHAAFVEARSARAALLVCALLYLAALPTSQPSLLPCPWPYELAAREAHSLEVGCAPGPGGPPVRGPARRLFALPIDPNRADRTTLETLPGIGPARAEAILHERAKRSFPSVEALRRVPGIGPVTLRRIAPLLAVGASEGLQNGRTGSLPSAPDAGPEDRS
jgi:aspartate kinase